MTQWTEEQQLAIESRDANILVAAAAGSGKTAVLVERIIQQLLDEENPLNIDEILVATFTNAAAEEMRNRIAAALESEMKENPHSTHLKKQHAFIQRSSISTLHAFCTSVVRQYAYLIDVDPAFRIGDEMEMDLLKQDVLDELFEDAYGQEGEAAKTFFTVVDMFTNDRNDIAIEQLILKMHTFAMQHPWPNEWLKELIHVYENTTATTNEADISWLQMLKQSIEDELIGYEKMLKRAEEIAMLPDGPYHYVEALHADQAIISGILSKLENWDDVRAFVTESKLKALSRKKVECDEEKKEQIKAIRDQFRKGFTKIKDAYFQRSLASHLSDLETLSPYVAVLVELVKDFTERFQAAKKARALVDFTDLEHFCLQILMDASSTKDAIIPSAIAENYQAQFKEVLVDEYQDINLVQETILQLVSDQKGNGNMFMVGDVKQSIYRFRHAEPTLFIEKYLAYADNPSAGLRIDLSKNFRSRANILHSSNYIFKQVFDEAVGDIAYDDKAALIYGNKGYDEIPFTDPSVEVVLIDQNATVPDKDETENLIGMEMEAQMYAKKIRQWIGKDNAKPMQVFDKTTNQQRDIQYRDIVILLRSLTGLPTIMETLKKEGIPVYAELKTGYFEAIEIQVMLNYLKIIDNPYQDIPLASVLRSPIFQLDEEELTQIRLQQPKADFFEAVKGATSLQTPLGAKLRRFMQQLEEFRALARQGALSTLIWHIFQTTGYYDFVGGIPGGKQRQANLRALYDRAKAYEETSFRGLFRFLRFIERMEEERKDLGEARALSEQEDVVRVMTIHKSKGLEFPVVMIGAMNKGFNMMDLRSRYLLDKQYGFATKYIDPEKRIAYTTLFYHALQKMEHAHLLSEEMRVLYVAMTRAKEKLVMIGTLNDVQKKLEQTTQLVSAEEKWLLPKHIRTEAKSYFDWVIPAMIRHHHVKDGLQLEDDVKIPHDIQHDDSEWKVEIVAGQSLVTQTKQKEKNAMDIPKMIADWNGVPNDLLDMQAQEEVEKRLAFTYRYQDAAISRAKQSVTELKRRFDMQDEYSSTQMIRPLTKRLEKRPLFLQEEKQLTAAEIGTAMHAVMQHIPLTKQWKADEVGQLLNELVEDELLTADEAKVIDCSLIERFFASDIANLLLTSERVDREVPFTFRIHAQAAYPDWQGTSDEYVLVQGVIDCLIHTEDGLIVLDYKTDAIPEAVITDAVKEKYQKRYEVQVHLYTEAMEAITGKKVEQTYLYFFAKDLTITM